MSDSDIVAAMRLHFERMKLVAEPSGASALAAVSSHQDLFAGRKVGTVLSGGNVGAERFARRFVDGGIETGTARPRHLPPIRPGPFCLPLQPLRDSWPW